MLKLELKKVKLPNLLGIVLVIPLLANIFGLVNYLNNRAMLSHGWKSLWTQVSLFYFSFFIIPLIALVVATLWAPEHKAGLDLIRTSPVRNKRFIAAKSLLALAVVAATQLYFLLCFYLGGKFVCRFGAFDLSIFYYYIALSTLFSLPFIAIFTAVAVRIRSLGVVTLLSTLASFLGFLSSAQDIVPLFGKASGLSFLALQMNRFERLAPPEVLPLVAFALLEIVLFYAYAVRRLRYDA
ncbi:MAG: ABC transporter permease [Firmicutes bacterium]|nr:ABC transporter permease [Bacillota bacterium]